MTKTMTKRERPTGARRGLTERPFGTFPLIRDDESDKFRGGPSSPGQLKYRKLETRITAPVIAGGLSCGV
jgi:hypothetical protein